MPKARATITGGKKLKSFLQRARTAKARGVSGVDVGFFASARYPDGTPVAAVAAWNELGVPKRNIPERPFMRQAIAGADKDLLPVLADAIDPLDPVFDAKTAGKMGAVMQGRIQKSITALRQPPNAPSTTAPRPQGKGSSNPLIDTGQMRASVTFRVKP